MKRVIMTDEEYRKFIELKICEEPAMVETLDGTKYTGAFFKEASHGLTPPKVNMQFPSQQRIDQNSAPFLVLEGRICRCENLISDLHDSLKECRENISVLYDQINEFLLESINEKGSDRDVQS